MKHEDPIIQEQHPIVLARKQQNLSLRGLARRLNLGKTTVARWETAQHIPTPFYAQFLAQVLGFDSGEHLRQVCQEWKQQHLKQPLQENLWHGDTPEEGNETC